MKRLVIFTLRALHVFIGPRFVDLLPITILLYCITYFYIMSVLVKSTKPV